jgi:predicted phage-related endonuclease
MTIDIERKSWLENRKKYIGGSDVASLFEAELSAVGEKPYLSYFRLWHEKAGNIEPENIEHNSNVKAGRFLERGLIDWLAHETGLKVEAANTHLKDDATRLAGTPDGFIYCPTRGKGVAEFKVLSQAVFKDLEGEMPLKHELQLQQYMGLSGLKWGCFGVLVTSSFGQMLVPVFRDFRPSVYAKIEAASLRFWDSIAKGEAPKADFLNDSDDVIALYQDDNGETLDLTQDNRIFALAAEYAAAALAEKEAKALKAAAKAEVLEKIGNHSTCIFNGGVITAKMVSRSGYQVEPIQYRDFRLKLNKEKTND